MTCTREQLLDSMVHEIGIIRRLASRIPDGALDWRPTAKQRSLRELLQYVSTCALVPACFVRDGNWDAARGLEEASRTVTPENFDRAMIRQQEELSRIILAVPHADLNSRSTTMPWGSPCLVGEALVNMVLKPLVAYRMQLFLWLKQNGRVELGPFDCWAATAAN